MSIAATVTATADTQPSDVTAPIADPQLRPLPIWYFALEGVLGGTYDLCKADPQILPFVMGAVAVNAVVSLTVLGKRRKLVRKMLKNSRTRAIAIALVALRFGVHFLLTLLSAAFAGATGHFLLAGLMSVVTVAMLWFDQRVSFRALGLDLKH